MDILAHALWAGAGVTLARRYWPIPRRAAMLTVALAVAPDAPHVLPSVGWSLFGSGSAAAVKDYAMALPGQEPPMPPLVELYSHTLHCITHSAIIAAAVTLVMWVWMRSLWVPLFGWWSHIIIDVFTHSADYYASPVLYPITREGFDGVAWNTPWFIVLNYAALVATYLWLKWTWPDAHKRADPDNNG